MDALTTPAIIMQEPDQVMIQHVLSFWFGHEKDKHHNQPRQEWFQKSPLFDLDIKNRFLKFYTQAVKGELNHWAASPDGSLALILLFDQFPRNMFRGTAQAFLTDHKALELAKKMIQQGEDKIFPNVRRGFIYLPFEHSENIEDQEKSVALFAALKDPVSLKYAQQHYQIIKRFGRFPHRNKILKRQSTPAEEQFLSEPNSSF